MHMAVSIRFTAPISPPAMIASILAASAWYRQWNASMATSPVRAATSATRRASSSLAVNGFSQSTCLPASSARIVHAAWMELGKGL